MRSKIYLTFTLYIHIWALKRLQFVFRVDLTIQISRFYLTHTKIWLTVFLNNFDKLTFLTKTYNPRNLNPQNKWLDFVQSSIIFWGACPNSSPWLDVIYERPFMLLHCNLMHMVVHVYWSSRLGFFSYFQPINYFYWHIKPFSFKYAL